MHLSDSTACILKSFFEPLRHKGLLYLYLATILGLFGNAVLNIYLAFDLASLGFEGMMTFFIVGTIFLNFFCMPLGFMTLNNVRAKPFFQTLLAMQMCLLIWLIILPQNLSVIAITLFTGLLMSPFWILFHTAMLSFSSLDNTGNEVGLAHLSMTIGTVVGAIIAGILLTCNLSRETIIIIGGSSIFAATALMVLFSTRLGLFNLQDQFKDTFKTILRPPQQTLSTIADSLHSIATEALWPVWIKMIGAGGLAVGLLTAFTVAMKFLLSPFSGYLTNKHKGYDMKTGALIKICGWVPWFLSLNPLTSLISSIFFASGSHLFRVGLESRWYNEKTFSHMASRELWLGLGRLIGYAVLIPILFFAHEYFVITGLITTSLSYVCAIHLNHLTQTQTVISFSKDQPRHAAGKIVPVYTMQKR